MLIQEHAEPFFFLAVMLAQRGERVGAASRRQGSGIRLREGHEFVEDAPRWLRDSFGALAWRPERARWPRVGLGQDRLQLELALELELGSDT